MNNKEPLGVETLLTPFKLNEYRKTYPMHQNRFSAMEISIASPEEIVSWSSGEITGSETVNYKTGKPEKNGLFCERIFGPVKSYECSCGKYKRAQHSAVAKCEVCGVELTDKIIRRVKMGHIKLETPVAHIWYHKVSGAQAIATLLENTQILVTHSDGTEEYKTCSLKNNTIEQIIYYQAYVLMDMGKLGKMIGARAIKPFTVWPIYSPDLPDHVKRILLLLIKKERENLGKSKNESNTKTEKNINSLLVALASFEDENQPFDLREYLRVIEEVTKAKFQTGSAAIQELLSRIDLKLNIKEYKRKLSQSKKNGKIPKDLLNKIDVFESFNKTETKPEWMILSVIPVIPADLRPMIALEGGRYSTTPLNELYRKIIIRNGKIKRLKEANAPDPLISNSLRLLQEAVDTLIDNKKRNRPDMMKSSNTTQKSLADSLLGKKGRFRQNLLGKRVDFSGRSVITVGPKLKLYQCGLPKELALELYKPFIMAKIIESSKVTEADGTTSSTITFKDAEKLVQNKNPKIWDYVHAALAERPVLLNRAPTLHRLGIQAFEPILVDGRAIQLHPLSTTAFNADFDGDQMAVHLPISKEAINEARTRMIGSSNILGPKDGKPIITPTQDMTLGLYFLTMEKSKANFTKNKMEIVEEEVVGEGKVFATERDAIVCHENKSISLHAIIGIRVSGLEKDYMFTKEDQSKILLTTVGKLIFNSVIAKGVAFINDSAQYKKARVNHDLYNNIREFTEAVNNYQHLKKPFTKKAVSLIIGEVFDIVQEQLNKDYETLSRNEQLRLEYKLNSIISSMLDGLKNLGFKYSTVSGISIAYSDIFVPEEKARHMSRANKHAASIDNYKKMGYFSKSEYTRRIVGLWNETKQELQNELINKLKKDENNPIYLMANSGARGNESNFTQLMGMRGIMTNPQGEAIAIPVKSSFREGLSINEFFISTHGARKGNVDTAMKTGHSGYLTRIFIDSCQNVTVDSIDCGTKNTYTVRAITEQESSQSDESIVIVPLIDRIFGRVAGEDLKKDGKLLVKKDQLITREIAEKIVEEDIEEVKIWSVLKSNGVSQKCFGLDLATNKLVELNTAVGVIAAQAIGEPGTQLTMNTFHTGGVADDADITQGLPLIENIVKFQRVGSREVEKDEDVLTRIPGVVDQVIDDKENDNWSLITVRRKVRGMNEKQEYRVRKQTKILVKAGDTVKAGQRLSEGNVQLYKIWKYAGIDAVYEAMLSAYHKVYRLQSISISDKYFEIVIKQMTNKIRIVSSGNTKFLPGQYVEQRDYTAENARVFAKGQVPAFGRLWILSAIQSSLLAKSFLWSISFQETTQYLAKAAIKGKTDPLQGLKENVIFGNLIPVGTGMLEDKDEFIFEDNAKNINKY